METNLHTLPPRKRLGLRQRLLEYFDYTLPTKKRSQSRRPMMASVPEFIAFPLPTKKRVRDFQLESGLIHQKHVDHQLEFVDHSTDDGGDYRLPAKKRKDSRVVVCDVDLDGGDMVTVQNRRRVCAFKPDFVFDLNVEYTPSLGEDCKLVSDFGSVEFDVMKRRQVKKELRMNEGYGFDDKIASVSASDGNSCAGLETVTEFGVGAEVTESKASEVVDDLGREEERLVEGLRLEIVSSIDNVETDSKESSEVVEEMGNGDEINGSEVEITEEKDFECVYDISGGVNGCEYDAEKDACVECEIDGNWEKSVSGNGEELGNADVSIEAEANICVKDSDESVDLDSTDKFNGVVEGCCVEAERDACVEGAIDGSGDRLFTGNDEELGNADASNEAVVNICEDSVECVGLVVADKVNGGVEGCCDEAERDACLEGAIDGNGDFVNTLPPASIHGGDVGESEAKHLKQVTETDGGSEGDSESEDGVICEICRSTDGDPSDPIVFCDGCDLMVHANCFGNPLIKGIPEGDWFCDKCAFQAEKPWKTISCCLCPSSVGVLKATNDGRWAHIVCAVFVPEAFFIDPEGREGIDVSKICAKRWKKRCYICEKMKGCVIDCSESKCSLSFHVTCGLKEDLCVEYREGNMKKGGIVSGFCQEHTKLWKKQQQTGKFKIVARKSDAF